MIGCLTIRTIRIGVHIHPFQPKLGAAAQIGGGGCTYRADKREELVYFVAGGALRAIHRGGNEHDVQPGGGALREMCLGYRPGSLQRLGYDPAAGTDREPNRSDVPTLGRGHSCFDHAGQQGKFMHND